ncbi:MAG TPA: plastocyanin/azurin family copper-binding protein [Ardenticatenaceae bacterium]|nr:plastocyanin/azurin family copper-binding protein [Ardenticatenaceae bacterium]
MRKFGFIQPATLLGVALLLLAGCSGGESAPASGSSGAVTPAQVVEVVGTEFAFAPNTITVEAGQPTSVNLKNEGAIEHDWSVLEIEARDVDSTPDAAGHQHSGAVPTLHTAAQSGQTGQVTFTVEQPGTYEFYCSVPGHKEAGMVGTLVVE